MGGQNGSRMADRMVGGMLGRRWAEGGQKVGRMAVWNPLSLFWTAILSFLTGTLIWQ
ncbi:hypothetical protein [Brevibacillus borstelensis]|uniref:hypothetical protein n=1 Tax=Brevibacillus borstelensis TaxID=45462 RepID=UPI003CEEB0C1